jgi:hypothetical protein
MSYRSSLTKIELLNALEHVPDDHEIFIVKDGNPLWLFSDVVDVAVEDENGDPQILKGAIGILACDEQWFE